ncbi:hypothetical protein ACIRBX_24395 [Kitasatospora sp. NPDC096147]|uniref:hypothetical protein n=1 Tax=Kitasatospora sp. NPDC096147 TaxID=3364093 RepID=UPI003827E6AD
MKRTRRFASWFGDGWFGETIALAREFDHPWYGRTASPAAALVAGWLHRAGLPATLTATAPRGRPAGPGGTGAEGIGTGTGTGTGGSLLWYSSAYLDPRLGAVGLALAAPAGHPALQREAQLALQAWQERLATRRVLLLGPPPSSVPAQRTAASPAPAPDPAGLAREYLAEGDSVLVLGPATPGLQALCPTARQQVVYIDHPATAEESFSHELDGDRLSFVLSPDLPAEDAAAILRTARRHYPHLRGQQPDQWSYRSSDLLHSLRLTLESADELWLLPATGPRHPLLDAALSRHPVPVRELTTPTDLPPHWLRADLRSLALMRTDLSGAGGHCDRLIGLLSGLGPVGVVAREVSTRSTTEHYLPTRP